MPPELLGPPVATSIANANGCFDAELAPGDYVLTEPEHAVRVVHRGEGQERELCQALAQWLRALELRSPGGLSREWPQPAGGTPVGASHVLISRMRESIVSSCGKRPAWGTGAV